jgi:GNAT superfamily N-acetyltransferase
MLNIHVMEQRDLGMVLDWAAAEGWNPGLQDAKPFGVTDPNGFLLASLDGQPVGCISVVAYDANFGFLGLFIVRPEFRGNGYGRKLFQAGLSYLGNRTIGLDGVPAQQENYGRDGFRFAYRTVRYEGKGRADLPRPEKPAGEIVDLRTLPLSDLLDYDARIFPAAREKFLKEWISQAGTVALGLLRSNRLTGYGVMRPCRAGRKIGPLFAENSKSAISLFEELHARVPGEPVYLDVPEPNQAAVNLAKQHGMKPVFDTARMYRGTPPTLDLQKKYGVTTLELG